MPPNTQLISFSKLVATLSTVWFIVFVLHSCLHQGTAQKQESFKMPRNLGHKLLNALKGGQAPLQHDPTDKPQILDDERFVSPAGQSGTYPRLTTLSDGSLLSSYTHFEGPTHVLTVARSIDGADTFLPWGEVTRGNNDVDNMYLIEVSPPGTILAAFRNHDAGPGGPTHFRITVSQSTDWGRSWRFLSQAAEKSAPFGIWEPFMRIGRQGEVQMTFSQEFAGDDQRTMMVKSFDQGRSWAPAVCVAGAERRTRDGMTGIARTTDNGREALVLVFETTTYGSFNVEAMISYDDGASWNSHHQVYVPPSGRNAGSPQIASFADGSMAVVFMTDDSVSARNWPFNAAIKVAFAEPPSNGYIRWTDPQDISPASSLWPGITALEGHRLLAMYEHGGPKGRSIVQ